MWDKKSVLYIHYKIFIMANSLALLKKHNKQRFILTLIVFLSSIGFLNPLSLFSDQVVKFMFYLSFLIAAFVATRNRNKHASIIHYPKKIYYTLILGISFSTVMVYLFQNQSFSTTVIATLPFLFSYLFLFVLLRFSLSKELLIKLITVLCILGIIAYLVDRITFPVIIFDTGRSQLDEERGIRINIPFIELDVMMFMYSINQYLSKHERKWLFGIIVFGLFIILSLTRQIILLSLVLGLLLCMQKVLFFKKLFVLAGAYIVYIFILPQIPLYQNMMKISEEQAEQNQYKEDDIRIQAWRFYTDEYQTNSLTYIFGNGVPSFGNSIWGDNVARTVYIENGGNGCYQADVGWAGFYWYFGLFSTFSLLFLLVIAIKQRKDGNEQYINYWLLFILTSSLASGVIIYQSQILSVMTGLYLAFKSQINKKNTN